MAEAQHAETLFSTLGLAKNMPPKPMGFRAAESLNRRLRKARLMVSGFFLGGFAALPPDFCSVPWAASRAAGRIGVLGLVIVAIFSPGT